MKFFTSDFLYSCRSNVKFFLCHLVSVAIIIDYFFSYERHIFGTTAHKILSACSLSTRELWPSRNSVSFIWIQHHEMELRFQMLTAVDIKGIFLKPHFKIAMLSHPQLSFLLKFIPGKLNCNWCEKLHFCSYKGI